MYKKLESIRANYIKGNISDFKNGVKKLTKMELLMFVTYWQDMTDDSTTKITSILGSALV